MTKRKLPKIKHTIFELELPSNNETVQYRAFTVKEEKILLIAQETKEMKQALLSIKQVVNNCLIDKTVEELSMIDLEYMLLHLRAKSIDNVVTFAITDPDTEEKVELQMDLTEVQIRHHEDHSTEIKVDENMTLFMRYPTLTEFSELMVAGINDPQANFNVMVKCMDKLVDEEQMYKFDELDDEDIAEFVEDLNNDAMNRIKRFFETMPVLRHEIKYKDKTGAEKTFVVEGMESFFV